MCNKLFYLVSFVLVVGLAVGVANADVQMGLIGYWPFEEGTGTTTADMSGNGHNGTFDRGVSWISPGYIANGAITVDGNAGSKVIVGTFDPGEQLTLAIWVRWTGEQNKSNHMGLFGKRDGFSVDELRWFSEVTQSGSIAMRTRNRSRGTASGVLTPFIDEWAHIAITFDGTTVRIYLNAEEVGSGPFSLDNKATAGVAIGNTNGGSSSSAEAFSGDMDEARIYPGAEPRRCKRAVWMDRNNGKGL